MDITLQKLPPQNIEAEQAVLGSMLLENTALVKSLEILNPDNFHRDSHKKIFSTIADLFQKNKAADMVTLTDELRKKKILDDVGGPTYIADLVSSTPTTANVTHYAKIVKEKSIIRSLISAANNILSISYEDTYDADELLDRAEKSIFEISDKRIHEGFTPIGKVVHKSFKTIEELYEKKEHITGVPSGFTKFDDLTAGLQPSDLIIIAGRPTMGKTSFALNIAQHASLNAGKTSAIFSLEMSKEQLVMRLMCSAAKVDSNKIRTRTLPQGHWRNLIHAADTLSKAKIHIDDTPAPTVLEIRAKARRLKAEYGLDLVIIDYLQLIMGNRRIESRQQEISEITRSLKALAKELNVPVVALSQLSRAVEQRHDKRPQLSDLRESGAIEQDADVVAFIYREEAYRDATDDFQSEPDHTAEILIKKQRNGPVGTVPLTFLKEFTRFENQTNRQIDKKFI